MINGVLLLDKPKNISSNKALYIIKKKLSPKKAGIVGILDPLASGMLPIVMNEGTKLAKYIENENKEYLVTAKLGYTSTTGDGEGTIIAFKNSTSFKFTKKSLQEVVNKFKGIQKQIPPMYSGLKVNGIKLYKLARQGISVKREPRVINITDLEVISLDNNEVLLKISCSKGTYIRTLVESIGDSLGTGAYTKDLRRIRIGSFQENEMISLDEVSENQHKIISLESITKNMLSISITDEQCRTLRYGQTIYTKIYENIDEIALKNSNSNLIGIGMIVNNYIHIKRLINFNE
jgi:tRNA pseudouridine55 synthase